jgi:leucyl-tRNA synthetase
MSGFDFAAIDAKWQARWEAGRVFEQPNPGQPGFAADRPKFYCLDMFPYPSGAGLHVGHPEGYTATDIVSRYKRMKGFNVLHPMGWDAFGLPAEQYAIQTGVHPARTTRAAIDNFRRQLKRFGFSYDWSREFGTIDPEYYKWTQWIFLRLYDAWFDADAPPRDARVTTSGRARPIAELIARETAAGRWTSLSPAERRALLDAHRLAYIGETTVNWCPKLGTVLANDEVIDGRSERGGHPVLRKPLRQWMFRITAYAERLRANLERLDWPASTKAIQSEWIGRSEGAEIDFPVPGAASGALRVFTTRPDTIFGATYMVVAPEHALCRRVLDGGHAVDAQTRDALARYVEWARNRSDVERQESREKTGAFTGVCATNPATGKPIPIWAADYVLMSYGTGAIMAVPGQDERDWEFAERFALPIVRTVQPPADFAGKAYLGDGPAINSGMLDGLGVVDAKQKIIAWLEQRGLGARKVQFKLRDWTFSRQRYWGEPFPIVYTADGTAYPVSDAALPVLLPELADYAPIESDDPLPLLAKAGDWVNTTAGRAGVDAAMLPPETPVRRETNTMPGSAASSWYALRYCDPQNRVAPIGRDADAYWMTGGPSRLGGVDLYVGGAEHAVGHLLYSRFWHNVLFDLGHIETPEPFQKLFHQGLITSFAYQRPDKSLVPCDEVEERADGAFVEKKSGLLLTQITAKMSKRLKNVINPDDVINDFGADTFRLYEMYMGPLEASKPWNTRDIIGVHRFLHRVWRLVTGEEKNSDREPLTPAQNPDRQGGAGVQNPDRQGGAGVQNPDRQGGAGVQNPDRQGGAGVQNPDRQGGAGVQNPDRQGGAGVQNPDRQGGAGVQNPDRQGGAGPLNPKITPARNDALERLLHKTIQKVGHDVETLGLNTAIAHLIVWVNEALKAESIGRDQVARFLLILAPFAPHICEELWERLGHSESLARAAWPAFDEAMTRDDEVEIAVQIKGKVRGRVRISADASDEQAAAAALAVDAVAKEVAGRPIQRVIVVKGRLVNLIV